MKLFYCPLCGDIVRMQLEERTCKCGESKGKYTDNINSVVSEGAIPMGIDNNTLIEASRRWQACGYPYKIDAWFIDKECKTVKIEGYE